MIFTPRSLLAPVLAAGALFAINTPAYSRDRDDHHHHHGSSYYCSPGYRSYYGGHSYYSRPYGYGYGYGPSLSLSFSTRPSYYGSSYHRSSYYEPTYYRGVVRSSGYGDDLSADVQRALARRGYYHGGIDGEIGPRSRAAIRNYQADRGLAVNGRIDRSLLRSLDLG